MASDIEQNDVLDNVLAHALTRLGYQGLPAALVRYLLVVTAVGPVFALASAVYWSPNPSTSDALWAVALVAVTIVAEMAPLHLTHRTIVNVNTAAFVAAILLLPVALPGVIALIAVTTAQLLRRIEAMEALFNIAQSALYVTFGALVFHATRDLPLGPDIGPFASVGSIMLAAMAMHVLNTALVAGASAMQLGTNPVRVWIATLPMDLLPHLALAALGIVAAVLARTAPLALPFLALPGVLVHRAVGQSIQLRVDTHEALTALVEVMELRDPYTAGHSRRVALLAREIAMRMGLANEEADLIERSGYVHDIGKAAMDLAILTKQDRLTDVEWEQMRQHPVAGANVVNKFAAYRAGARIVRHHHEAWNGQGYPDGLEGEMIPLGSRIIAVADTYDALTSNRPYRRGTTVATAIDVLERGAGTQWDARIVAVTVEMLRTRITLPTEDDNPTVPTPPRGAVVRT